MKEQHPSLLDEERNNTIEYYITGVVGIEPTHGASKVHCLTDLAIPQILTLLRTIKIAFVYFFLKSIQMLF